jgi:uncharacterized protein with gpF-like domain
MTARDRAVRPFERSLVAAVRDVQAALIDHYTAAIRSTGKAEAGGLDLEDDDENRDFIADAYRTTTPAIDRAFRAGGRSGLLKARVGVSFDVRNPQAERWLRRRQQRFVEQVADSAWREMKAKLSRAMEAGTSIDNLVEIVEDLPAFRPERAEMIARTEVIAAYNGGLEEGFRQSGNVQAKVWLAALDDRTRETHTILHDQRVPVGENFVSISGATGPAPGQMGAPGEDINCRCSMEAIVGFAPQIEEVPPGVNETEVLE